MRKIGAMGRLDNQVASVKIETRERPTDGCQDLDIPGALIIVKILVIVEINVAARDGREIKGEDNNGQC